MNMNDIAFLDATAQADLVRKKDVSPIELVEGAIERIEGLNPGLNAVIHTMFEQARDTARAPETGPFSGVPNLVSVMLGLPDRAPVERSCRR